MNRNSAAEFSRMIVPILILSVGIGGFWVFGQRPEVASRESTQRRAPLVATAAVESHREPMRIEVEGVAVPYRQVTVSAEVGGRVVHKGTNSRAGSFVRQDDFLLQVDPTDYELEVAGIEQEFAKAEQEIKSAEVDTANTEALIALAEEDLALRQKELTRRKKLFSSQSISESEFEEAQRLELASRNSLQTLRNQLAALRQHARTLEAARELIGVRLERARIDEKRTVVRSPLAGTVNRDFVEQGDFVSKGDPLYLLTEAGSMEVKCSLRVDQLYWVWLQAGNFASDDAGLDSVFEIPTTDVEVVFEFGAQQYTWQGELSRYEGTGLDADTRMVPCRVRVDRPSDVGRVGAGDGSSGEAFSIPTLFTGMYVTVRIPIDSPIALLSMPTTALRAGGQVWVVRDGKLQIVPVEVASTSSERVIVRRPHGDRLAAGDRVVVSPLPNASQGMPVAEGSSE